jgi:hypothetical protein
MYIFLQPAPHNKRKWPNGAMETEFTRKGMSNLMKWTRVGEILTVDKLIFRSI